MATPDQTGGANETFVETWFTRHRKLDNAAFREVLELSPPQRDAIMGELHQRFGNDFVSRGLAGKLPEEQASPETLPKQSVAPTAEPPKPALERPPAQPKDVLSGGLATAIATKPVAEPVAVPIAAGIRAGAEAPRSTPKDTPKDLGDYSTETGEHVTRIRRWSDSDVGARRVELQKRLALEPDAKARQPIKAEYDAITWVAHERGIKLPEDPEEQAAIQKQHDNNGESASHFWLPDTPLQMRALFDREFAKCVVRGIVIAETAAS